MEHNLDVINRTVAKTYEWVSATGERAGLEDAHDAYQVLRSVLHALRDRLDANVAAHLAAQMPILLKGVFYDGWDPNRSPQRTSMEGFLSRVEKEAGLKGTSAAEDAVRAVMSVLWDELGPGAIDHLLAVLPKEFTAYM